LLLVRMPRDNGRWSCGWCCGRVLERFLALLGLREARGTGEVKRSVWCAGRGLAFRVVRGQAPAGAVCAERSPAGAREGGLTMQMSEVRSVSHSRG
jgi:hypothetical protein